MKVAVPVWDNCVSTVLDFSDSLLVVDFEAGRIKDRSRVNFAENTIVAKTARLRGLGVQVLLCGAVSRPLENMIIASGIRIVPFLMGTVDEVIEAYFSGRLQDARFVLPGCRQGRGMRGRGLGRRRGGGRFGRNNI